MPFPQGVLPALTTPFEGDEISAPHLRRNLARYERTELAGYLVLGSTGEAALLDPSERRRLLEAARETIPAGKLLIAGVGAESTRDAERQIEVAAACGAEMALLSTPHYFRDEMTHRALTEHFRRLADRSPIPLLLYNVPKFTSFVLPVETVAALSDHERIAGIKESSGDPVYLERVLAAVQPGFAVVCGSARLLPRALAAGARASILAAAAAIPEPFVAIARAAERDGAEASRLHRRLLDEGPLPGVELGVPAIKAAMDLRGLHGGPPRSPLRPVDDEDRRTIQRSLEGLARSGMIRSLEL